MARKRKQQSESKPGWRDTLRRARRWTLALVALAVLGYAALDLADYVLRSDLFMIRDVEVEGNCLVSEDEILERLDIPAVVRLWQVDPEALKARLADLPPIKSVEVRRLLPQTLSITIEERAPLAICEDARSGRRFAVDDEGYLIADAEEVAPPPGDSESRDARPAPFPVLAGLSRSGWKAGERIEEERAPEVLRALGLALAREEEWTRDLLEIRASRDARGWVLKRRSMNAEIILGDRHFVERIGRIEPVLRFLSKEQIEVAYVDLRFDEQGILIRPRHLDPVAWVEKVARRSPSREKQGPV
ncbi:MAG: FtsQ-type POTRA domain-containing protein [Candidatus Omnitrophica bacterium]|nr:Cell division protein FtsQ [bacterium]NUN96974.1 FtsQ-type POTRA domain-containing protein [Candidatus Omnitrophota bacterium]